MLNLSNVRRWHCLFEQSNTFRDEFRKLGFEAFDYDIGEELGKPDFKIDLFDQIEKFGDCLTVFDGFKRGDAVIAFFPCIRFSMQAIMMFQQTTPQCRKLSVREHCEYAISLHEELHRLYVLINRLVIICDQKRLPLIIENPYRDNFHYLNRYWWKKPDIIDLDRRLHGDYFEKPTQFFFFGCKPYDNLIFEPQFYCLDKRHVHTAGSGLDRSVISPYYARRFIRSFLLPAEVAYNVEVG